MMGDGSPLCVVTGAGPLSTVRNEQATRNVTAQHRAPKSASWPFRSGLCEL